MHIEHGSFIRVIIRPIQEGSAKPMSTKDSASEDNDEAVMSRTIRSLFADLTILTNDRSASPSINRAAGQIGVSYSTVQKGLSGKLAKEKYVQQSKTAIDDAYLPWLSDLLSDEGYVLRETHRSVTAKNDSEERRCGYSKLISACFRYLILPHDTDVGLHSHADVHFTLGNALSDRYAVTGNAIDLVRSVRHFHVAAGLYQRLDLNNCAELAQWNATGMEYLLWREQPQTLRKNEDVPNTMASKLIKLKELAELCSDQAQALRFRDVIEVALAIKQRYPEKQQTCDPWIKSALTRIWNLTRLREQCSKGVTKDPALLFQAFIESCSELRAFKFEASSLYRDFLEKRGIIATTHEDASQPLETARS